MPHRLLVRAHGPRSLVPGLLARFRCRTCGEPPVSAEWIDNPAGGAPGSGYPPKRRVPMRPPPSWRAQKNRLNLARATAMREPG